MPSKPTLCVIGGCNGAGKTTFAREFLPTIGILRFLNADEIARGLSPLAPATVALKAGRLLLEEVQELLKRQETFALESTLSGRTYVRMLRQAREQGYLIQVHFVWIPDAKEAIRRVRQRVRQGGHDVPVADIQRRFQRSIEHLLADYLPLADEWQIWDNTNPPAKLLASWRSHTIIELQNILAAE